MKTFRAALLVAAVMAITTAYFLLIAHDLPWATLGAVVTGAWVGIAFVEREH